MDPFVEHFIKSCAVVELQDEALLISNLKDHQLVVHCSNTGIPFIDQTDLKLTISYKGKMYCGVVDEMKDAAQIHNVIVDSPKRTYEMLYANAVDSTELVAKAMESYPKVIFDDHPRFNRYTSNKDFRAEFVELLVNDDDLIDRLIELADFQVYGHDCHVQTADHPNSDCDDCYSGDTEFEMAHILDSRLASIWKATREKVDPNWATKEAASDGEDASD